MHDAMSQEKNLCVCTCKQCQESGGSPAPWPFLQRRKQPWVQEMTPPSEGGRKAEDNQMCGHVHRFQKFSTIGALWSAWLTQIW